jgi:hypothetical protein
MDSENNVFINKSFNIVRLLVEKDKDIANNIEKLEEILDPVFEYMKNPSKITFDEEIIAIISSFIKIKKSIVISAQKLFINLDKYFAQSNQISDEFYELLSYFILYGGDFLLKDANNLNLVRV